MIPSKFQYHKANTVAEAINLLSQHGSDVKALAGGHSLLPAMKLRLNNPEHLVDIGRIPALKFFSDLGDHILIGAGATHNEIANEKIFLHSLPMVAQAAGMIGDPQVRNKGTIGGSIAHADPAADWPAVLLATKATITVEGPQGERQIPASDFFTGLFSTALNEGELITKIAFPKPGDNAGGSYQKFAHPASRYAVVGCAALVTKNGDVCEDVSVAFSGVSGTAFRDSAVEDALRGKELTAENIAAAAQQAAEGASVMSDHFASEKYRKHLAKVYCRRALEACV